MPDRPKKFRGSWMPKPGRRKDTRPSAAQRGYDQKWAKVAQRYLATHPMCVHCAAEGKMRKAVEVDHIVSLRQNHALKYDLDNLQALCKRCHSRKTAIEDGGLGRPLKIHD